MFLQSAGCAIRGYFSEKPAVQPPSMPVFPPQKAIQSGDYAGFLAQNEAVSKNCQESEECAEALFNIAFAHVYSPSPFYNVAKGQKRLEELILKHPDSPWAYQARVWMDLIRKSLSSATKTRKLQKEVKSKQGVISDLKKQMEQSEVDGSEEDRLRLEEEIKTRDATIEEMNKQLQRYRQIDEEMEQRERELFR